MDMVTCDHKWILIWPTLWCIEFWDFGQWDEMAGTRCKYKAQAVELAQKMNREMTHEARRAFEGHRFRVRRVREFYHW